ncbi:hypothetical protein EMIHUDRAFT_235466 [Emiliania huxleyi CCMP1516]|uniref:Apple domain-containing protein n=2 Tax=Emiliania huxleyi TaxID=2903 RepID=A0A0D3JVS7_EMIH1|nr:hypothetical protein EMIHUDRAFT_235466 [Emiliania huxleyi CCMP1516]EOD27612.1 hypothetical protein EMIHUDRAFT_235466 [Emiliania huxleyi CCMP1516]|eukprot:XP_005780041.1 hypothetical protein EMIHUDRAFT_235466 [Emiliania huxleyi CCMP1516]
MPSPPIETAQLLAAQTVELPTSPALGKVQRSCSRGLASLQASGAPDLELTSEPDASACQARCAGTSGCAYFTWWSGDGGCHLQDANASPILTTETNVAACQARCASTTICAFFTFWTGDGGCHL